MDEGHRPSNRLEDKIADPIDRAQSRLRNIQKRWAVDQGYLTQSVTFVERGHGAGPPTPTKGNHVGDENAWINVGRLRLECASGRGWEERLCWPFSRLAQPESRSVVRV